MSRHDQAAHRTVACFFFLQGLCAATWTSQIPALQVRLQLNHAQLGTLLLGLSTATFIGIPWAGWAQNRGLGPKSLTQGAVWHAASLGALSMASGPWASFAALFLFGLSNSWVQVAVNQQALSTQADSRRPVMARCHGAWSVAAVVAALGAYASGWCGVTAQHHLRFVACVAATAALALARQATLHLKPKAVSSSTPCKGRAKISKTLWQLALITALAMALEAICFDWGAVRYRHVLASGAELASLGYAALMLGMTGGRLVADACLERFGAVRVLLALAVCVGMGLQMAVWSSAPWAVLCGLGLQGLGLSAMVPILLASCNDMPEHSALVALAWTSTWGAAGALVGPTALGWLAQAIGLRSALGGSTLLAVAIARWGCPLARRSAAARGLAYEKNRRWPKEAMHPASFS